MKFKKFIKIISFFGILSLSGLAEAKPQEPKHDLANKQIGNVIINYSGEALYQAFNLYTFRHFNKKLTNLGENKIVNTVECQRRIMSPYSSSISIDFLGSFQYGLHTLYGKKLVSGCADGGYFGTETLDKRFNKYTFYQLVEALFKVVPDLTRLIKENKSISTQVVFQKNNHQITETNIRYLFPKDSKDYYDYSDVSSLSRVGSSL